MVGLDSCPKMATSPSLPPYDSMNFSDWTNIPPEPQHGSYTAVMRRERRNKRFDDAGGGVELAAALAFGAGEHAEEIFVHPPQHIARLAGIVAEADGGDEIDQLAQLAIGQRCATEAFVEDVFELGVFRFDDGVGIVDALADVRLLGGGTDGFPARGFWHPEYVYFFVVVAVFQLFGYERGIVEVVVILGIGKAASQLGTAGGEGVGDVFDEDQAGHEVLVFGGIGVGT